jgi:hypothetical protein
LDANKDLIASITAYFLALALTNTCTGGEKATKFGAKVSGSQLKMIGILL